MVPRVPPFVLVLFSSQPKIFMASMISLFIVINESLGGSLIYNDILHGMIFSKYFLDSCKQMQKSRFLTIRIMDLDLLEDIKVLKYFFFILSKLLNECKFINPAFWKIQIFPGKSRFLQVLPFAIDILNQQKCQIS